MVGIDNEDTSDNDPVQVKSVGTRGAIHRGELTIYRLAHSRSVYVGLDFSRIFRHDSSFQCHENPVVAIVSAP